MGVGSKGLINPVGFQHLKTTLNITTFSKDHAPWTSPVDQLFIMCCTIAQHLRCNWSIPSPFSFTYVPCSTMKEFVVVCVREVQFCCLCFTLTALVMCFLYAVNLMQLHVTMYGMKVSILCIRFWKKHKSKYTLKCFVFICNQSWCKRYTLCGWLSWHSHVTVAKLGMNLHLMNSGAHQYTYRMYALPISSPEN